MAQIVLVCSAENSNKTLDSRLANGWNVKIAVAEVVSVSKSHSGSYSTVESRGKIVYILEKE